MTRDVLALMCVLVGIGVTAVAASLAAGLTGGLFVAGCGLILLGVLFGLGA